MNRPGWRVALEADPRLPRQERDGGLLVLWRDATEPGRREGLACALRACANRDCGCTDVQLDVNRVDEGVRRFVLTPDGLAVVRDGDTELPLRPECSLSVDCRDGSVRAVSPLADEAPLRWVAAAVDGALLDLLWEVLLRSKGVAGPLLRDRIRRRNWKPNELLEFTDVVMNARPDRYRLDGAEYEAVDLHCVMPDCTCDEIRLEFFRLSDEAVPFVATFKVALDKDGGLAEAEAESPADGELAQRLWQAFAQRYPDPFGRLRGRREQVRAFRPVVEAALRRGAAAPRAERKIGRNDPCPCGSGRKYKQCCLRKAPGA